MTGEKEWQGTGSAAALMDTFEQVPGGAAGHKMDGSVLVCQSKTEDRRHQCTPFTTIYGICIFNVN